MTPPTPGAVLRLLSCALLLFAVAGSQTTWHVAAGPGPGTGAAATPFASIQVAIDAAASGDLVLVRPGTYTENLDFSGKNLEVRAIGGAAATVIDGGGSLSCVRFMNGEVSAKLTGFTLRNGSAANGGGVLAISSQATVAECVLTDNAANGQGGGVHADTSTLDLLDCHIQSNAAGTNGGGVSSVFSSTVTLDGCLVFSNTAAGRGGGIATDQAGLVVLDTIIEGNTAAGDGGGVSLSGTPFDSTTIRRCEIRSNTADFGGGLRSDVGFLICEATGFYFNFARLSGGGARFGTTSGAVSSCVFARNDALGFGGGIYFPASSISVNACTIVENTGASGGGGVHVFTSAVAMQSSIIWNNAPDQITTQPGVTAVVTHSDVQGGFTGVGNFDANPQFLDAANLDYRIASTSPCINAGMVATAATDFEGNPRAVGSAPDAGADEFVARLAGTADDLALRASIDGRIQGVQTLPLATGETLGVQFTSPGATLESAVPILVASSFPTNTPPNSGVPGIHIDLVNLVVLYDGALPPSPFFGGTLGSQGIALNLPNIGIPAGITVRIQGAAFSPLATNGQYGTTDALDVITR